MKTAVRTRKNIYAFLTGLLLLGGQATAPTAGAQTSEEAVSWLQMSIRLDGRAGTRSGDRKSVV